MALCRRIIQTLGANRVIAPSEQADYFLCVTVSLSFCRIIHSNADTRIGAAVIEKPATLVVDQTLSEDGTGRILSATLKVGLRHKEGFIETTKEFCGVIGTEQSLTGAIGVGRITAITISTIQVLTIINKNDTILSEYGGRAALRQLTVKESLARRYHLQQLALVVESPCQQWSGCEALSVRCHP